MEIYDQIREVLKSDFKLNDIITLQEIKSILMDRYGMNPGRIILTDYCYNRFNDGIPFTKHLFEYIGKATFKYLGENYPYTGKIYHKPKQHNTEIIVGEWINGGKTMSKQQ